MVGEKVKKQESVVNMRLFCFLILLKWVFVCMINFESLSFSLNYIF